MPINGLFTPLSWLYGVLIFFGVGLIFVLIIASFIYDHLEQLKKRQKAKRKPDNQLQRKISIVRVALTLIISIYLLTAALFIGTAVYLYMTT